MPLTFFEAISEDIHIAFDCIMLSLFFQIWGICFSAFINYSEKVHLTNSSNLIVNKKDGKV